MSAEKTHEKRYHTQGWYTLHMYTTTMTSLHITMKSMLQVRNPRKTVLVCISKDNVGVE